MTVEVRDYVVTKKVAFERIFVKKREDMINKERREGTPPPQILRIVNTSSEGSEISELSISMTVTHVRRVNLQITKPHILNISIP